MAYRKIRGMQARDEQMALLIQRVSGSQHQRYFFPDLAGVALSHNSYVWRNDLNPEAGLMRIVLGLGTRAVDRVEDDYPRIVALDQPLLTVDNSADGLRRFSQHRLDVLDTETNNHTAIMVNQVASLLNHVPYWKMVAVHDHETTQKMKQLGLGSEAWLLNFEKLLDKTSLVKEMQMMLQILEKAYNYPVDTEFTINFGLEGEMRLNLLQCRPLQTLKSHHHLMASREVPEAKHLIHHQRQIHGLGYRKATAIHYIY